MSSGLTVAPGEVQQASASSQLVIVSPVTSYSYGPHCLPPSVIRPNQQVCDVDHIVQLNTIIKLYEMLHGMHLHQKCMHIHTAINTNDIHNVYDCNYAVT